MTGVTQINLVVRELERSRTFYEALGCQLRPITMPGDDAPRAWEVTSGFAPIGLHTAEFAAWWDSSAPSVHAGSTTIDVTFDVRSDAVDFIETVRIHCGQVMQELTDMPWGEAYAICADPDDYRWGVKSPTSGAAAS